MILCNTNFLEWFQIIILVLDCGGLHRGGGLDAGSAKAILF